jgi:hypothetical protein
MTSITVPTHLGGKDITTEQKQSSASSASSSPSPITGSSCPTDRYQYVFQWPRSNQTSKTARALSYNEERIQQSPTVSSPSASTSNNNNNRFKHLCTRLKRRFSISKEYRTKSEDMNRALSVRFNNYQSFSSSIDDTNTEYDWPDFEKVYDSIPHCLTRALPGLDDISLGDDDDDNDTKDTTNFLTDENNELLDLFQSCTRGKHFRRNAICRKLDKTQYGGQLDTFIQQLMIEKLMRTWT